MEIVHTNESLREAVKLFFENKEETIKKYRPNNKWNTSNVTDMSDLFSNSYFNEDISNWNVNKVHNFCRMFKNAKKFNQDLSKWEGVSTSRSSVFSMFVGATAFNQYFRKWRIVTKITLAFDVIGEMYSSKPGEFYYDELTEAKEDDYICSEGEDDLFD